MKKKIVYIGLMLMTSMVITTGCSKGKNGQTSNLEKDPTENNITQGDDEDKDNLEEDDEQGNVDSSNEDPDNNPDSKKEDNDSTPEPVLPVATKEIMIYTFNDVNFNVESAVALVPQEKELTPELVVDMVVLSFTDRMVEVGIDYVSGKDDTVIISFTEEEAPYVDSGSGLEGAILDALAQSIVENFPEYPKVIFRVEDKAYSSGHYEFKIDEVYLDGNRTN